MNKPAPRWKYWLVPGATLLIAAWLLAVYAPRRLEPLAGPPSHIVVEGELRHVADRELIAAVRPQLGARFFELDVGAMHAALTALPWVESAAVRKRWPNAVVLHVRERVPAARWQDDALVSARGEVFTPPAYDGSVLGLPLLRGPDPLAAPMLLEALSRWQTALAPLTARIDELAMDARGAWSLKLASGPSLQLGREQPDARLARYTQVVVPALGARLAEALRIDLRYSNGFAVAWRAPAPATEEGKDGEKA